MVARHYIAYETTAAEGNLHRVAHVFPDTTEADNYSGEHEVPEITKDNARDVGPVRVGWYYDSVTHQIFPDLPVLTGAAPQRDEIKDIIRSEFLPRFDADRFDAAAATLIRKYARNVLVYTNASTTDAQLDKCKTAARVSANDVALYADSTWPPGLDTPGLRIFVRPEPLTPGSAPYPAAEAGMPNLTASALTSANLAALLA